MMVVVLAILALLMSICVTATQSSGFTFTRERLRRSEILAQRGSGTSEVEAILSGSSWITSITVGSQVLRVQIDTGSSALWLISTLSDEATKTSFPTHKYFDPSKSPTWQLQPDLKFNTSYDIGEEGSFGVVGTETVELGGVTVTDMLVGAATHVYGGTGALDPTYDGIMGLGWGMSSDDFSSGNSSSIQAPTFMEVAQSQLSEPVFTCDLRANEPETISFGFVNSSLYTGSLSKLSIDNSTGDWLVNNVTFSSGDEELGLSTGLTVIFDTGGLGTTVDAQTAEDYWGLISGSNISSDQVWSFPCNTAALPDLTLSFPGGAEATLSGLALNGTAESSDGVTCIGGLQIAKNGVFNVGNSFFGNYFTVWNQQELSFSFAPYSRVRPTAMSAGPTSPTGLPSNSAAATSTVSLPAPTIMDQNTAGTLSNIPVLGLMIMAMSIWTI